MTITNLNNKKAASTIIKEIYNNSYMLDFFSTLNNFADLELYVDSYAKVEGFKINARHVAGLLQKYFNITIVS